MSARGILQNPAIFAGHERLPAACVGDFLDLAGAYGLAYPLVHNHILFMLYPLLARSERRALAECSSVAALLDFCAEAGFWQPPSDSEEMAKRCDESGAEEVEEEGDEKSTDHLGGREGTAHGPGRGIVGAM